MIEFERFISRWRQNEIYYNCVEYCLQAYDRCKF